MLILSTVFRLLFPKCRAYWFCWYAWKYLSGVYCALCSTSTFSCRIVASIAPKMDQTSSSYININIKSKSNLSDDISLHTDSGNVLRLEFLSRLPAMEEWHKFRVSDVTSQDVESLLQQLRKMPDIEEANLDKPKMKIKRWCTSFIIANISYTFENMRYPGGRCNSTGRAGLSSCENLHPMAILISGEHPSSFVIESFIELKTKPICG